ncbi:DUF2848 domain-containing protein [Nguyenibacter vanlangensis]|uniref:DUF2848 domain-containing protein n=1 Tax=Nguyenibacter vanlangensis TaxID=1216886 RepID=A0ABZ3D8T4_9PROT
MLKFSRIRDSRSDVIWTEIDQLVVAGWAGRDSAAIEHHIQELEAIGVPRPSSVPVYYRVGSTLLCQSEHVDVLGTDTSGEVEPLLVALADGLWIGLASDHTDRKAETIGIALSKQLCIKPVARELWHWDDVKSHWDEVILRAWIEEDGQQVLYQEGNVSLLRTPTDLLSELSNTTRFIPGSAMLCGTVPVHGGIRPSAFFAMELDDPVLGRTISHSYRVNQLPVVS